MILGGTGEGRALAFALVESGQPPEVTSSLAGRVADPALPPGRVRVGGFGGVGGLARWLTEHAVDAVVDATHPFAATMSQHAAQACSRVGTPLLRLQRPGWSQAAGDVWHRLPTLAAAAGKLDALGRRAFLTIGRQEVAAFADVDAWCLVRAIEPPEPPLPRRCELLLARGPFDLPSERETLRQWQVDVLVSKDSGGEATAAKLTAARELHLPVVLVDRPPIPEGVPVVDTVEAALAWVAATLPAI
nr:cobalt-precorrin-6A reductase [Kineosphaera limosa]